MWTAESSPWATMWAAESSPRATMWAAELLPRVTESSPSMSTSTLALSPATSWALRTLITRFFNGGRISHWTFHRFCAFRCAHCNQTNEVNIFVMKIDFGWIIICQIVCHMTLGTDWPIGDSILTNGRFEIMLGDQAI
jgi:hypothetical protein